MSRWDDRFLEYIYENGKGSPAEIANYKYVHVSRQYVSKRLRELADNDLLDPQGNGVYHITKQGRYYLAGGWNAEKGEYLHEIDPEEGLLNYERMGSWMWSKLVELR